MYLEEKANKELKSILSQFVDAYRMICESSRNAYMKTLSAGDPVPQEGAIYGENFKSEFESMSAGYREKALEIVEKKLSGLRDKATEAPSAEAVNSIALLNMRKDITEDEIDNLLTRYGDNVQVWKTLVSIAKAHDIHVFREDTDLETEIRILTDLEENLEKALSVTSALKGHATEAFMSMVAMDIDRAFPVEG